MFKYYKEDSFMRWWFVSPYTTTHRILHLFFFLEVNSFSRILIPVTKIIFIWRERNSYESFDLKSLNLTIQTKSIYYYVKNRHWRYNYITILEVKLITLSCNDKSHKNLCTFLNKLFFSSKTESVPKKYNTRTASHLRV